MNTHDKIIAGIASRFLDIPTLETHNSDSLDFHEVCVSNLKEALEAAFMAGQLAGEASQSGPRRKDLGFIHTDGSLL